MDLAIPAHSPQLAASSREVDVLRRADTGRLAHQQLAPGPYEYGQKTRPAYRANLELSEDGNRICLPVVVVDRIDVVDLAPNLGAIASDTQSPPAWNTNGNM